VRGLFFTLSGNLSSSKTAVDGREKAQKAQSEKDGVETVVTHSVKVSVSAKLSFFCAFCAFSRLTAFSQFIHRKPVACEPIGHRPWKQG